MQSFTARFQSRYQYYIVGIGHILTGEIISGIIEYRNQIRLTLHDEEVIYTITDVQTIEYMTAGTSETALILDLAQGDKEISYLKEIAGQVIDIVE
jgi:hypothetical protein